MKETMLSVLITLILLFSIGYTAKVLATEPAAEKQMEELPDGTTKVFIMGDTLIVYYKQSDPNKLPYMTGEVKLNGEYFVIFGYETVRVNGKVKGCVMKLKKVRIL